MLVKPDGEDEGSAVTGRLEGTRSGTLPLPGGHLVWELAGAGPPVVLIHGFSLDRRMWDAVVPLLATNFTVIRYDLRGFGESSPMDLHFAYSHAEDLAALLDHLEVDVKHNETSHFTALLGPLDLEGAVVTFDALHTVRANLDWLAGEKKGHYIAVVKNNQPLLHARIKALPWRQVPAGSLTRDTGHGRAETRTLKAAHVSRLDFPRARQAIKITRWRKDTATGKASRETSYAITSLTSADASTPDLARLVREHWSIEAHHHVRDVTFHEDTATSRTGSGPANLATIRAAIIAAIKDAGYLHIPEGRRDHTTPAETLHLHDLD